MHSSLDRVVINSFLENCWKISPPHRLEQKIFGGLLQYLKTLLVESQELQIEQIIDPRTSRIYWHVFDPFHCIHHRFEYQEEVLAWLARLAWLTEPLQ
jgi:hypothetical protein